MLTKTKLGFANHQISRVKNILPKETLLTLYNCLFKPYLEYGIIAWGGAPQSKLRGVINLQKKCVRNIGSKRYLSHTEPIFRDLEILKFNDLFEINCLSCMHDFVYKHDKNHLGGIFEPSNSARTKNLLVETCKKEYLKRVPNYFLPRKWNSCSVESKNLISKTSFKQHIFVKLSEKYISNPTKCRNLRCPDCYRN